MASKFLNWLTSTNGRVIVGYAAGVVSTSIFGLYLAPHSALLGKHQDIVQMYNLGDPVRVAGDVQKTANEVLQESTLKDAEKKLITFFTVFGFDMYHAGSTQLRTGAIVGIPNNFSYKDPSYIDTSNMTLMNNKEFSWNSPTGLQLLDSFVFSKFAQKFAIAREISFVNSYYVYINSFTAGYTFFFTYLMGRLINIRLDLYKRPRSQRMVLYSMLSFLGVIAFILVSDVIQTFYEGSSDTQAAEMGYEYVLGGVEFYEKLISRNKALRTALGDKGESMFTAGGNLNEILRVSHIPLDARLDKMKKKFEESNAKMRPNLS